MVIRIVARRLAVGLLILWATSVIVFVCIHVLPGDAAETILGKQSNPYMLRVLRQELGLSKPLLTQYINWLDNLVTLNWGKSLVSSLSVASITGSAAENTAILTGFTMIVLTPLAIVLGAVTATKSGKLWDNIASLVMLCLNAVPDFVVAIILIYFLAANVAHLFPAASLVTPGTSIFSQLVVTVLPTATLVLVLLPYPTRMVRASMIEVLQSDYIMMARLKGMPERRVIMRHALRNAMGPMVQACGLTLLFLSGGVIIVEAVFNYPGLGETLITAVNQRDIPVIQVIVVLVAAACVLINLISDLVVLAVTPKLRARL